MSKEISKELYEQLITNHEKQLKALEERRQECRAEVKYLGEQIRFIRLYLKRNKENYRPKK